MEQQIYNYSQDISNDTLTDEIIICQLLTDKLQYFNTFLSINVEQLKQLL